MWLIGRIEQMDCFIVCAFWGRTYRHVQVRTTRLIKQFLSESSSLTIVITSYMELGLNVECHSYYRALELCSLLRSAKRVYMSERLCIRRYVCLGYVFLCMKSVVEL